MAGSIPETDKATDCKACEALRLINGLLLLPSGRKKGSIASALSGRGVKAA